MGKCRKKDDDIELTGLKIKAVICPHAEYRPGSFVSVTDEGSFYRIDGTCIIDKFKIKAVRRTGDRVEIEMTDGTVVLEIKQS